MPSVAIICHLNLPSDDAATILQTVSAVEDALESAGMDVESVAPWARAETQTPTATGLPNLLQVLQQQSQQPVPPTQPPQL